jgi:hypothetical protein
MRHWHVAIECSGGHRQRRRNAKLTQSSEEIGTSQRRKTNSPHLIFFS